MNTPDPAATARNNISEAQRLFNSTVQEAGLALTSRLTAAAELVQREATELDSLERALELYDGLEQTRMAAKTRTEIATAVGTHRSAVEQAKAMQHEAWTEYHQTVTTAAAKLAATQI